eukprot:scaffold3393_cov71-Phaeocystis_antarctica.AAC.1
MLNTAAAKSRIIAVQPGPCLSTFSLSRLTKMASASVIAAAMKVGSMGLETVTSIAKGFALRNQAVATMSTSSPPVREEPRPVRRSQFSKI